MIFEINDWPRVCGFDCDGNCHVWKYKVVLQLIFDNTQIPTLISSLIIILLYLFVYFFTNEILTKNESNEEKNNPKKKCYNLKEKCNNFWKSQWPFIQILIIILLSSAILTFVYPKILVNQLIDYKYIYGPVSQILITFWQGLMDLFLDKCNCNSKIKEQENYKTIISRINYPYFFSYSIVLILDMDNNRDFAISLIVLSFLDFSKRVGWKQPIFYYFFCKKLIKKEKSDFIKVLDATKFESSYFPLLAIIIFKISNIILLPSRHMYVDCNLNAIEMLKPSWEIIFFLFLQQILLDFGSYTYDVYFRKKNKWDIQERQLRFPKYYSFFEILAICGMCFVTSLLGIATFGFYIHEMPPHYRIKYIKK